MAKISITKWTDDLQLEFDRLRDDPDYDMTGSIFSLDNVEIMSVTHISDQELYIVIRDPKESKKKKEMIKLAEKITIE